MPSKAQLESVIRAAVQEAVDKILAAIDRHEDDVLASVQKAVEEARGRKPKRAPKPKSNGVKKRKQVPTERVIGKLLSMLSEASEPMGFGELSGATRYSDGQVRRGLVSAVEEKLVLKSGQNRGTVYKISAKGRREVEG